MVMTAPAPARGPAPRPPSRRSRTAARDGPAAVMSVAGRVWLGLGLPVIAVLYPLLWMVFSSFKDNQEVFDDPGACPGGCAGRTSARPADAGVRPLLHQQRHRDLGRRSSRPSWSARGLPSAWCG